MKEKTLPDSYFIQGKEFKMMIPPEQIEEVICRIAMQINSDYASKTPLFLVVLKGSIFVAADLLRHITIDCEIETVRAASYGKSMESTGKVGFTPDNIDVTGKDVIIIEDIVDTGLTMKSMMERLTMQSPASLEAVAFLSKPAARKVDVNVKYIGIEIPPRFVIGYGLDYSERGRHLPAIYSLASE